MTADPALERIVGEAASWIVRLDQAEDPAMRRAWQQWHDADPRHAAVWRRFGQVRRMVPDAGRAHDLPAAHAVKALAAGATRRSALKLFIGGAVGGVVGSTAWWQIGQAGWLADYRTAIGEQRQVALAHDVRLTMNTGTAVDMSMTQAAIDIRLIRGEITLDATAWAGALRLLTRDGEVLLTRARLAARLLDDATQVALAQGRAVVHTHGAPDDALTAGAQRRFAQGHIDPVPGWFGHAFAWTDGILIADDMRLDDFLAELGRYRVGTVRCAPEVASLRVSGSFRTRHTDAVLQAVAQQHRLRVVYRTRYWVSIDRA